MQGISFRELPSPCHAFFEQTVFKGQISDAFFQGQSLRTQILYLRRCSLPRGNTRQPALASFKELFRPAVIKALRDTFTSYAGIWVMA